MIFFTLLDKGCSSGWIRAGGVDRVAAATWFTGFMMLSVGRWSETTLLATVLGVGSTAMLVCTPTANSRCPMRRCWRGRARCRRKTSHTVRRAKHTAHVPSWRGPGGGSADTESVQARSEIPIVVLPSFPYRAVSHRGVAEGTVWPIPSWIPGPCGKGESVVIRSGVFSRAADGFTGAQRFLPGFVDFSRDAIGQG